MLKCYHWPIGVCSWSLQMDVPGVAEAMKKLDLEHIHLAVRPALEESGAEYLRAVREQNWTITSCMIDFPQEDYSSLEAIKRTGGVGPDEYWPGNKELVLKAIDATADLEVKYLSFHAGFLDHTKPAYAQKFYDRVGVLADAAQLQGVVLLMETGQETAADLRLFLEELNHSALAVNFDPANMILYDKGNPIEAMEILARWIKHIHIKDAHRTKTPGTWGAEVPWGAGQVNDQLFLHTLKKINFAGALAVEREAGSDRLGDIKFAVEKLSDFSG
ncbi:MAG: xylose isomerase [Phycisphaerae bacterium SM23_30]|nr:MAG: xylose isomerase [Phycisphaerae bacterium SM23_30]